MYCVLLVLGLTLAVNARDCLKPDDMQSFDLNKYEGNWYELAWSTGNKSEENEYDGTTCVKLILEAKQDHFEAEVKFEENGKAKEEVGQYKLVKNQNSFFHIVFPEEPEYNEYLYKIVCTDYNTYAVIYSGAQYGQDQCSEYTVLVGRDRSNYANLAANEDVKKCLQDKLNTSIEKLKPIPQSNCQN